MNPTLAPVLLSSDFPELLREQIDRGLKMRGYAKHGVR
jgi:hypothetical protein